MVSILFLVLLWFLSVSGSKKQYFTYWSRSYNFRKILKCLWILEEHFIVFYSWKIIALMKAVYLLLNLSIFFPDGLLRAPNTSCAKDSQAENGSFSSLKENGILFPWRMSLDQVLVIHFRKLTWLIGIHCKLMHACVECSFPSNSNSTCTIHTHTSIVY